MTAYVLLSLSGLLGKTLFLYQFVVRLPPDPQALLNGALMSPSLGIPLVKVIVVDLAVIGFAFLIWLMHEATSLSMRRRWVYVVLFFTTPLAFLVPLFLLMRERRLAKLGWE